MWSRTSFVGAVAAGWSLMPGLSAAAVARFLGVTPAVVLRGMLQGAKLLSERRLDPTTLVPAPKRKV
jgi:hypothetical protein